MSNESSVQAQTGRSGPGPSAGSTGWFRALMELYRVNETYIQEVVDASRKILQTVLEGLVPGGRLKHAPIRTFFRILSGMIFILKVSTKRLAFASGNYRAPNVDSASLDIHTRRPGGRRTSLSGPPGSHRRGIADLRRRRCTYQ